MAMFKGDNSSGHEVGTVIGAGVKVEGNFTGEGNVVVDGQLQGSLKTKHNVQVGAGALVKANVEAHDIQLAGELHGNVKATGKLVLAPSAKLTGNVEVGSLSIAEGASFNGKCAMLSSQNSVAAVK